MDSLFFHPKIVHLPMALAVLMPLVAGAITLAWVRGWLPARAWVLAVALQAVLVVSGIAALRSGEAEEERVEQVVPERFIEAHEEAAELFVAGSGALFGLMLVALVLARHPLGPKLAMAATLGTLAVAGLGYRTGEAGGALVYRHGAGAAYVQPGSGVPAPGAHGHHDDEDDENDEGS